MYKALIGSMFFVNGGVLPSVFLDLSEDEAAEERIRTYYLRKAFDKFQISLAQKTVSVFSFSSKQEPLLTLRFCPNDEADIDAFLGMLSASQSQWALTFQFSESEITFIISADTGQIVADRVSEKPCKLKTV